MTFYEQELRKIVGSAYPDASYVGRTCYVRLDEMNRAKIQFITTGISKHYDALRMTILNRQEGEVDNLALRFSDLLGKKDVMPHIWDDAGDVDWYIYHPSRQDYEVLTDAVSDYLGIFQEQEQVWQQTMQ